MPVAIKFDIGELPVTLSREDINYADEVINVIDVINAKINLAVDDIAEKYEKYLNFTDLKDYINYIRNTDQYLIFKGDDKLRIDKNTIKNKPKLIINDTKYTINKDKLGELDGLYHHGSIHNGKIKATGSYSLRAILYNEANYPYINKNSNENHWSSKYHNNKYFISKSKLTIRKLRNIAGGLGFNTTTYSMNKRRQCFVPGGLLHIYNLVKYIRNYMDEHLEHYEDVPQAFIDADKQAQKEVAEAKKGKITAYSTTGVMIEHTVGDLLHKYDYIFYVNRRADITKQAYYEFLYNSIPEKLRNKYKLIYINPTTIKSLKKFNQFREVEDMWKVKNLKNFYSKLPLIHKMEKLRHSVYNINSISTYYGKVLSDLSKYYPKLGISLLTGTVVIRDLELKKDTSIDVTNFEEYFKDQLIKAKQPKTFIGEHLIEEMYSYLDLFIALSCIRKSIDEHNYGRHNDTKILKEAYNALINKYKIYKINRLKIN